MKPLFSIIALLCTIIITSLCFAVPTLTTPAFKNVGANMATLAMQSSGSGTGYFSLLPGSSANCGNGAKVAFGPYSSGSYHGSLPLFANVTGNYTVRNLAGNTPYTACFTADSPNGANLNPTPVSANLTTDAVTALTGLAWRTAGSAGFSTGAASFTSLTFSPDGIPYLAYADDGNNGKATVRKYRDGLWSVVGIDGFSSGGANYTSLALAPDGIPYVAYSDDSLPSPDRGKATVRKYNGTVWELVGSAGFSADTASSLSLAFAPDGNPYVAYSGDDYHTANPAVMKFDGNWSRAGNADVSSSPARHTSLAVDSDGTLYVAYADDGNSGKVSVKKLNDSVWENVGDTGLSVYDSAFISLAISPDGFPHVAYSDYGLGGKAVLKRYNGTAWEVVDAEVSAGQANFISLAFAPDGKPVMAYVDADSSGEVTAKQYSGTHWDLLGSAAFSAGTANFTSLALSPDGTPYVAYMDDANGSRATVMKLADLPPTISGTPAATATVGVAYSFTPAATNTSADFTIENQPPWTSFEPSNGQLSGTPAPDDAGSYSNIVITAHNRDRKSVV